MSKHIQCPRCGVYLDPPSVPCDEIHAAGCPYNTAAIGQRDTTTDDAPTGPIAPDLLAAARAVLAAIGPEPNTQPRGYGKAAHAPRCYVCRLEAPVVDALRAAVNDPEAS